MKRILIGLVSVGLLVALGRASTTSSPAAPDSIRSPSPISTHSVFTDEEQVTMQAQAAAGMDRNPSEGATPRPRFEVVHSLRNARFDGGRSFYVLIDPIDLANSGFKEQVKKIVRILAAENGAKISVEIHDSMSSLTTSYKQYGDLSLGRPRSKQEDEDEALHFVAAFSGDLRTGIYLNTLQFFTVAFSDHSIVGKYVETIEFNPR